MNRPKLNKNACPDCEFISETFPAAEEMTKREYWLLTEVFVYLHGTDYCNNKQIDRESENYLDNIGGQ